MNNFSCPTTYTGATTLTLDAQHLQICNMHDLARLCTNTDGSINTKIILQNLGTVTLNCVEMGDCKIAIDSVVNTTTTFEVS